MDDLISREKAIDAHYEYCNKHPDAGFPVWSLKILEDLPSAQPETHDKRTETHACDCISRQAAIEALQEHRNLFCDNTPETFSKLSYAEKSRVDELDMAIATLINLPSAQPEKRTENTRKTHGVCLDTISRNAAIDALTRKMVSIPTAGEKDLMGDVNRIRAEDISVIRRLPSAQPDSKELSSTHKALDTISRQAAIRWVKTECNPYGKPTLDFESGKKVIEHLKQMPSAQPEQTSNNDCNGCKFVGGYDTDFPCANCIRKNKDYYAPERRTDDLQ